MCCYFLRRFDRVLAVTIVNSEVAIAGDSYHPQTIVTGWSVSRTGF